jgi:hypothetical protein
MALVLAIRPVGANSRHDGDDHPILVRAVDNPANEPLESFVCVSSGHTFTVCPASGDTFTVPLTTNSGQPVKCYVIEYVSGTCQTAPGEAIDQVFLLIPSGGFAHYFVPVNVTFNSTLENDYTFAQQTRLYANPGQAMQMRTGRIGALPADYACTLQFSGYLVKQ